MVLQLHNRAQAESLVARGVRSGADFRDEITAASDSALFSETRRLGPGAVLGPDSIATGWRVTRVLEVRDTRLRTFDEARELVEHDWYGETGERLMRELVARSRKQVRVTMNHPAITALVPR